PVAENVVYELVAEEQPQQVIQQEVQESQGVLEQQQDPAQGPVDPNIEQQPEGPDDIDFCPCCAKFIRREAHGWEVISPDA
ncbi:unnamed protein product, partial [Urochloa humidicola]